MANSTATFVAQHVMQIKDVQKLKNEALTVTSAKFKSNDDPMPIEFEIEARFGSHQTEYLSVLFVAREQDVIKRHLQFWVIDHEGKILEHKHLPLDGSPIKRIEAGAYWGYWRMLPLNLITGPEVTILRILEYFPSESASDAVIAHLGVSICKTRLAGDRKNN